MTLRLFSWNACSVIKEKRDMILHYAVNEKVDVICIQETWLKPYIEMGFHGYNIIRHDRIAKDGGGVMIAICSSLHFEQWDIDYCHELSEHVEVIGCKLYLDTETIINVVNIYNPSGNNKHTGPLIVEIFSKVPKNEELILVGDFNAYSNVWCRCNLVNNYGKSIEESLLEGDIYLANPTGVPTRRNVQSSSYSTLDLVFTRTKFSNKINNGMIEDSTLYSDHSPVLISVDKPSTSQVNSTQRFNIKKANWQKF